MAKYEYNDSYTTNEFSGDLVGFSKAISEIVNDPNFINGELCCYDSYYNDFHKISYTMRKDPDDNELKRFNDDTKIYKSELLIYKRLKDLIKSYTDKEELLNIEKESRILKNKLDELNRKLKKYKINDTNKDVI